MHQSVVTPGAAGGHAAGAPPPLEATPGTTAGGTAAGGAPTDAEALVAEALVAEALAAEALEVVAITSALLGVRAQASPSKVKASERSSIASNS